MLFLLLNGEKPLRDLQDIAEKTGIKSAQILLEIEPQIKTVHYEISSSNFDASTLSQVCHLCQKLNQLLTQLLFYAPQLPNSLKARLIYVTGPLDEGLTGDVMAVLTLIQVALKTGDALPATLPVPLSVRSIELMKARISNGREDVAVSS